MTIEVYLMALSNLLKGAAELDWSDPAVAAERARYLRRELYEAITFLGNLQLREAERALVDVRALTREKLT